LCSQTEETRTKIASLEQSMSCLEDELSDTRMEASKLRTELVSERSAWEVKCSEMQSRINEVGTGYRYRQNVCWQNLQVFVKKTEIFLRA
jgi:chromosome segregation ATPase